MVPVRDDYNGYMREYMMKRYYEKRVEALNILGGNCAECGSDKGLQIDHVDRSKKTIPADRIPFVSKSRFLAELKQCQLLCQPCHTAKTLRDLGRKPAEHGSLSMAYRCKTKCEPCRLVRNQYNRDWKRKQRAVS